MRRESKQEYREGSHRIFCPKTGESAQGSLDQKDPAWKSEQYLYIALKMQKIFCILLLSHSAWSGWIEISANLICLRFRLSPTPHGVGGLKYGVGNTSGQFQPSHSAWSGWIEISGDMEVLPSEGGPTPHGVGGLKLRLSTDHHPDPPVPLRMEWVD